MFSSLLSEVSKASQRGIMTIVGGGHLTSLLVLSPGLQGLKLEGGGGVGLEGGGGVGLEGGGGVGRR